VVIGTDNSGADTRIEAGGLITISAANNETGNETFDGTFNAASGWTERWCNRKLDHLCPRHGLTDGDIVTYDAQGHLAVGGLTSGRQYSVVVLGTKVVQLGATFDGASIDALTDEIVFTTPHNS